ncbi:MAG: multicopper oxidase family protein [Planctomycetota bacterium]
MKTSRREFLYTSAAAVTAGNLHMVATSANAQHAEPAQPGIVNSNYRPVETPNGATLPFRIVNGVKIYHLIVEPVTHTFAKGLEGECWGYNGRVHGPTIEAVEGDRIRIYVTNKLPVSTTTHWHGLLVPSGMDGVGGLSQRPIEPGETFKYEFILRQHGTFMYHSHHDEMTQMAMGLMGMIVIHPKVPGEPPPDRDFVYLLSEWKITPGTRRPDPNEMSDFNVLTLNAKIFPATAPMVVRTGQKVRIRFGNLSAMDHHTMHLHGYNFKIVETDGGVIPEAGRWPETTVIVPVGSTRTVEFTASDPGDWAMHCHMTHHVMTQMGHDIPNLIGVDASLFDEKLAAAVPVYMNGDEHNQSGGAEDMDEPRNSLAMVGGAGPFGYITMGGMFTILKVRDDITNYTDPGWYKNPDGTVASPAMPEDLTADGIKL